MDRLLDVRDLNVTFHPADAPAHAVSGLSYSLRRGETYGIAGESGCGKTSSARALLGLLPKALVSGELVFSAGERYDLADQGPESRILGPLRGRRIALTFQEPTAALDPLRRIGDQVAEVVAGARGPRRGERRRVEADARETLRCVGLDDPDRAYRAYPHEMSGGMRQRAALALALGCRPDVLIADEPTTALDGLSQARVLQTLQRVAHDCVGALLIITHDLAVLASLADRVAVMYAGRLVEEVATHELMKRSRHPYTLGLLAAVPRLERGAVRPQAIPGAALSRTADDVGCAFARRCAVRIEVCGLRRPDLVEHSPGHRIACWRAAEAEA